MSELQRHGVRQRHPDGLHPGPCSSGYRFSASGSYRRAVDGFRRSSSFAGCSHLPAGPDEVDGFKADTFWPRTPVLYRKHQYRESWAVWLRRLVVEQGTRTTSKWRRRFEQLNALLLSVQSDQPADHRPSFELTADRQAGYARLKRMPESRLPSRSSSCASRWPLCCKPSPPLRLRVDRCWSNHVQLYDPPFPRDTTWRTWTDCRLAKR